MEQTPKNPSTLETEDQGEKPLRQTKKRPVDVIRILNFRTGPQEKKKPDSKAILKRRALKSTCKWSTNFLVKNQKRTRRPEETKQPFLQKRLRKQKPSVHPSGAAVTELEDAERNQKNQIVLVQFD